MLFLFGSNFKIEAAETAVFGICLATGAGVATCLFCCRGERYNRTDRPLRIWYPMPPDLLYSRLHWYCTYPQSEQGGAETQEKENLLH